MLTFKQLMEENIHARDTVVTFPHKGKVTTGKVERHIPAAGELPAKYVINHDGETTTVRAHKVQRVTALDEAAEKKKVCSACGKQTYQTYHGISKFCNECQNIDPETLKVKSTGLYKEAVEKWSPAVKTQLHYQGQINGKTYVVPHSSLNIYKKGGYPEPMRHAIVTSLSHTAHNNPSLSPEEHARVHSHIKDIHGGQEPAKLKEEYEYPDQTYPRNVTKSFLARAMAKVKSPTAGGPATRRELKAARGVRPGAADRFLRRYGATKVAEETENIQAPAEYLRAKAREEHAEKKKQSEAARYAALYASRKAATLAFAKKHHIINEVIKHGDEVEISHNYGVDSGKQGTVLHPNKVRTNGRGVPTDVPGAYKPVDHKKEHVVKLHSGSYAVVPKGSLTKLKEGTMKSFHDVAKHHQTKIAKQTLRMPDAMVGVMGGGSKEDARAHLKKVGWTDKMIHHHEHGPGDITMHHLDERTLTGAETDKKEELVHHMKKNIQGFKERYGKDAKSVMYATATADAKRLAEGVTEGQHDDHPSTYKYVGKHKASGLHVFDDQGKKELFVRHTASHGRHSGWGLKHQGHHYEYVRNLDEAAEQILELSKNTLKSYIKKAAPSLAIHSYMSGSNQRRGETAKKDVRGFFLKQGKESEVTSQKREKGITRAAGKLEEGPLTWLNKKIVGDVEKRHTEHEKERKQLHKSQFVKGVAGPKYLPKAIAEDAEQLQELSKTTLKSYIKKAAPSLAIHSYMSGADKVRAEKTKRNITPLFAKGAERSEAKSQKREAGIVRAASKLTEDSADEFLHHHDQYMAASAAKYSTTDAEKAKKAQANMYWHARAMKHHLGIAGENHPKLRHLTREAKEEINEAAAPFMTTYKRNESANRHTANIVHLAKHFGDEADQAKAKFYADELKKHGHNIHHEAAYALHQKLWPKAIAAHTPAQQTAIRAGYGDIDKEKRQVPRKYHMTADVREEVMGEKSLNEEVHAYDVHHNGKHIDTIFYGHHEDPAEVKRSLVNHDNYHPDITVKKQRSRSGEKLKYNVARVREEYRDDAARDRSAKVKLELDAAARSKVAKKMLDDSAAKKTMKEESGQTFKTVKKVLAEKFTRQHYQMIADTIRQHPDAKVRQKMATRHAAAFAKDNPRFSHERFHAAAGTSYKEY